MQILPGFRQKTPERCIPISQRQTENTRRASTKGRQFSLATEIKKNFFFLSAADSVTEIKLRISPKRFKFQDVKSDKNASSNAKKRAHIVSFILINLSKQKIVKQLNVSKTAVHNAIKNF